MSGESPWDYQPLTGKNLHRKINNDKKVVDIIQNKKANPKELNRDIKFSNQNMEMEA